MTRIINVCKGWGCDLTPYCEKARFSPSPERDCCYVREFIPTTPGEGCPEYEVKRKRTWGDGPDPGARM